MVLRLEGDLLLVHHHSGVGGDGDGGLGVHIAPAPGDIDLSDQGDDDQGHRNVEHEVHDRDPVLQHISLITLLPPTQHLYSYELSRPSPQFPNPQIPYCQLWRVLKIIEVKLVYTSSLLQSETTTT